MAELKCPSCGAGVPMPQKKSTSPWLIGCLVAVVVLPVLIGVIGMLAAIAIPSFVKARQSAQNQGCINNLRIIDAAKEQAAIEADLPFGAMVTTNAANQFIKSGTTPLCPAGGVYRYNVGGTEPTCSLHGDVLTMRSAAGR